MRDDAKVKLITIEINNCIAPSLKLTIECIPFDLCPLAMDINGSAFSVLLRASIYSK